MIALHEESIELDSHVSDKPCTAFNEYLEHARDEHIRDLYRHLRDEAPDDPSIHEFDVLFPNLNTKPISSSLPIDQIFREFLGTHPTSMAASRNVQSLAELTDAEFEELKAISVSQNAEFLKQE